MIRLKNFFKKALACALVATTVITTNFTYNSTLTMAANETTEETFFEDVNLSDFYNWKKGIYQSNGHYDAWNSFLSTKEYMRVTPGEVYKISCSSSEYYIVVSQFDADFNIVSYDDTIYDGSEVIIKDTTKYVTVSIYNPSNYSMTYTRFSDLFADGFTISQEKITDYSSDVSKTNLNNPGLWKRGLISTDGSKILNYTSYMCLRNLVTVDPSKTYVYKTNISSLRLIINELDENEKVIQRDEITNESTISFNEKTKYLSISAYNASDYSLTIGQFRYYLENSTYSLSLQATENASEEENTKTPEETPSTEPETKPETPEQPADEDLVVNENVLTSLDSSLEWVAGTFDEKGQVKDINDYIRLDSYYLVNQGSIKITMPNNFLRLIINEYDENKNFIKSVDLGNCDIFTADESAKYVTYSLYEYSCEEVLELETSELISHIDTAIDFTVIEDLEAIREDAESLTSEVHKGTLSNASNYRYGHYYSWGGYYEQASGVYCTRNKYAIQADKTYYLNVNDSRMQLALVEYDSEGNTIRYVDHLTNGSKYEPSQNACYVAFNLSSSVWGVDILGLLDAGLTIDLNTEYYCTGLESVDIDDFDFADFTNYQMGSFSSTGFNVSADSLATSCYLDLSKAADTYRVNLDNHYLRMTIVEYTEDGTYVKTTTFQSGEMFTPDDTAAYIGVYIKRNTSNYTESDYRTFFNDKQTVSLTEFTSYKHNTTMNAISATEFMNTMNVGWNLGNSLDSHYGDRTGTGVLNQETTWGNIVITEDLIEYVKAQGFNTIRIPVTWYYNTYTDENGNLKVVDDWFERVQTVVDYAIKNDMYVILNTHHEQPIIYAGTSEDSFNQVLSDAEDLWTEIATYFADYDEHLIFESYNEVDNVALSWNYSDTAADQMNQLNQLFVDTVRATGGNNSERLLIVPTLLDGYESSFRDAFSLPTDSATDKLIVEVHDYSTAFDQDIDSLFEPISNWSAEIGAPVIIGEFGTKPNYSPSEYRAEAASNYVARAAAYGIKCVYWDDGNLNNYGLVNRVDYSQSNTEVLSAIVNAAAYETSNKTTYNSMDSFVWMSLNQSTGALKEDKYWGTIVTDIDGKGVEIPEGAEYLTVLLSVTGEFYQARVHYVHFYDENMKVLQTNNSSSGNLMATYTIPEGAKYVRVGINNSYMACKEQMYASYFNSGLLSLTLGFVDLDDSGSYVKVE